MNTQLSEINDLIELCDAMISEIYEIGDLKFGNRTYETYKSKIRSFMKSYNLYSNDYGPYIALSALFFTNHYTVNLTVVKTIRRIIVDMKHDLLSTSFDKIFISHREKNREQVAAFVELLYAIGIPRPTVSKNKKSIFCTSQPASYIDNGDKNLDVIRRQFSNPDHVFFILWYSDDYFESQACLNEAGAIWASGSRYQEILMPEFDSSKIGGLMDKQRVWFRANDAARLNSFKQQLESMFSLDPLEQNAWETARDAFIRKIVGTSRL